MGELFKVINLSSKEKVGNLKAEANSIVKSKKYFPIFNVEGRNMIFKPMSKTKPLTTPFFAYSEVFWSYCYNKFFDERTPRYFLAVGNKVDLPDEHYYEKGVLVEPINSQGEVLVNLFDYFMSYVNEDIGIKDYINYCEVQYDYTPILNSEFVKRNPSIGEDIAFQVLLSILRQDQNFHYENINFILSQNGDVQVAAPIDFEFSTPFMFPDQPLRLMALQKNYFENVVIKDDNLPEDILYRKIKEVLGIQQNAIGKNLRLIVRNYPEVVKRFLLCLSQFINGISSIELEDEDGFIEPFNSDSWELGHALYKEKNLEKFKMLSSKIVPVEVDRLSTFNRIKDDILNYARLLEKTLKILLISSYNGICNLENITLKSLEEKFDLERSIRELDDELKSKQLIKNRRD